MKQLSSQAQVAKNIRAFCKSIGVKCSARSDSFSMGDSVHWEVENINPTTFRKIEAYADQHQYGSFNGMEDIYESTNRRNDIPQTKYCSGKNKFTDDFYQAAWELFKASASNGNDKPALYKEAQNLMWCSDDGWQYSDQISQYVYKILVGSEHSQDYIQKLSIQFWINKTVAPVKTLTNLSTAQTEGVTIEEHIHTKKNFKMFIVVLADRVSTDKFNAMLEQCKEFGGWYSRKWGNTPNGFAFKTIEKAEQFKANLGGESVQALENAGPKNNDSLADKLTVIADNMQDTIADKFRDRETNTQKRIAQAASARIEGEQLQRTQTALYKLATMHKNGSITPVLANFKSKKSIYDLMATNKKLTQNGYHSYYVCTGEPRLTTAEAVALWELIDPKSPEQKTAEELKEKINNLQFAQIPGYFPTPNALIDLMIEKADIKSSDRVLEPSAGSGAICDRVAPLCKEVKAFEVNYSLAEILDAKDYLIEKPQDFLTVDPVGITSYEKILMNPPFERLQDIDHIKHAFKFLKKGGRLVSIMSHGGFFRSDAKAADFREWFENIGGESFDIPAGAFKESNTNISTKMIIIDKNI